MSITRHPRRRLPPGRAAPPREIRLRPEVAARLGPQWIGYAKRTVDPRLPAYPGFEVYRVAPGEHR